MSAPASPPRAGGVVVAIALVGALVAVVVKLAPSAAAGPASATAPVPSAVEPTPAPAAAGFVPAPAPAVFVPAAEPAAAPPVGAAGYNLMDLPAIKRAVHGSGRPVLVHFWASWCGPCLEELPLVDKFVRETKGHGVEVISLSLDDAARAGDRVVKVLSQSAPNLTRNIVQVSDSDAFVNSIDPQWEGSIPAVFAFDAHGTLRGRIIGEASRRDLEGLVARVSKR